jgi:hypothetical protein
MENMENHDSLVFPIMNAKERYYSDASDITPSCCLSEIH